MIVERLVQHERRQMQTLYHIVRLLLHELSSSGQLKRHVNGDFRPFAQTSISSVRPIARAEVLYWMRHMQMIAPVRDREVECFQEWLVYLGYYPDLRVWRRVEELELEWMLQHEWHVVEAW